MSQTPNSTATAQVNSALDALDRSAKLNAITHLRGPQAIEEAKALDAAGPSGSQPLFGQPVVIKANIEVAGMPFDGASPALAGVMGQVEAPVVARLRAAGAVVVGLANLHELAFGITSANAHYGHVATPLDPTRMAGGSSGGTGAAVGAGAVPAGLGSDTGGSGRLPAAMCGCVGFRPTTGRYDGSHLLTLSHTLDTVAPFGADVAHVAALDAVMAGVADDEATPKTEALRIGVVEDPYWSGLDADMEKAGRAALQRLENAGVTLVTLSAPDLGDLAGQAGFPIALHETLEHWTGFARVLKDQSLAEFAENLASPDVKGLYQALARGELPDRAAYDNALHVARPKLQARMKAIFAEHELNALISPTLIAPPPKLGMVDEVTINGEVKPLFEAFTARALIASVAAVPALSMPFGAGPDDLPMSIELVGAAGQDRALLAVARTLEGLGQ